MRTAHPDLRQSCGLHQTPGDLMANGCPLPRSACIGQDARLGRELAHQGTAATRLDVSSRRQSICRVGDSVARIDNLVELVGDKCRRLWFAPTRVELRPDLNEHFPYPERLEHRPDSLGAWVTCRIRQRTRIDALVNNAPGRCDYVRIATCSVSRRTIPRTSHSEF